MVALYLAISQILQSDWRNLRQISRSGRSKCSTRPPDDAQSIQLINSSMFTSHTKHKRGDITGSRLKKSVSKRIVAQFGEQQARTTYPSNKPAEHIAQPLDDEQVARNNDWVSSYNHNLFVSAHSSTNQADEVLNLAKQGSAARNRSQLKSSTSTSDPNGEFLRSMSSNDPQREQHDLSPNKHEVRQCYSSDCSCQTLKSG